ncbi:MAG: hypothetical protein GF349_02825 [Candidatus Magasanikbacteria bacterium]|nr:hypothetical protein [Candidatus Magasanikbacteria bacterium]
MHKLQKSIHEGYRNSIGWKGIIFTAWIGTPIHEIGHIFFAFIFRHKIHRVNFFQPNKKTGSLGHVDHSYNKLSIYQQIGNFFVGSAPMIFGSILLMTMVYFLIPGGKIIYQNLSMTDGSITALFSSIEETLLTLFSKNNLKAWNFWLFLYISFCISAHIAPSRQDRKGMWKGFIWIVILILIINIISYFANIDSSKYLARATGYMGILTAVFVYTLLISFLHLVAVKILFYPFKK